MTKTRTLQTLVCVLALLGAGTAVFAEGTAVPAQTVATAAAAPATPTVPATTTTTAPATTANGLTVSRLVVGTDVQEREPVGAASTFSLATTARLYAFVEVANPKAEATTLEVAWLDLATGKERQTYTLDIQAHKRWRTWARMKAPKTPGAWAVVVRDETGVELARAQYELTP